MQDPATKHLVNVLLEDLKTRYSGGLERLLVRLASVAGQEAFGEWSKNPVTKLFRDALDSLADTCINQFPQSDRDLATAYGCQSGLRLAARLVSDPTRVFPSIFDGEQALVNRPDSVEPEAGYTTPADGEAFDE